MVLDWLIFVAVAYLLGSIPFGLLLGRLRGVDIREHGSGNIGATNAGRVLGRGWGRACFVLDVLKGAVPTLAAGVWTGAIGDAELSAGRSAAWVSVGLASILGHVFPVWLGFRGGKGVATSLGALAALWPIATLPVVAGLVVWVVTVRVTRYVGVASVAAAVTLPVAVVVWSLSPVWGERAVWPAAAMTGALAALVVWRHRDNLRRTFAGTEPKIGARTR